MGLLLPLFGFINTAFAVSGDNTPPSSSSSIPLPNLLGSSTLEELATKLIQGITTLSVPLITIMVLWGGFQILTAAGNEKRFEAGKNTLKYAVIGTIVILVANGVIYLIADVLRGGT